MTVIAGEPFTITVPFSAHPIPKPSWTVNGEDIYTDERIKFETNEVASKFINRKAKRTDTGNYTIHLSNSVGSDSASCKVLVVGEYNFAIFNFSTFPIALTLPRHTWVWGALSFFYCTWTRLRNLKKIQESAFGSVEKEPALGDG